METERLIINEVKITDKEDYFSNISHDKEVLKYFVCTYQETLEGFDFSKYLGREDLFAIRLKESKKFIGIISTFNNSDDSIEIGYGIGKAYWNKGYVTEAIKEFINYLFEVKKYKTVYASYFIGNDASKRVMEKVGMVYSHIVKNEMEYLGIMRDCIYYKISI